MKNGTWNSLWWLLLVGMISLVLCAPFFRAIYDLPDEGIFLRGAELILRGKRLYGDFFEFMPPGSYLVTAGWFEIAGVSIESARTLAVLTIIGIACFTFLACRQVSRNALLSAALPIGWVMMTQWHWMQVSHHWFTTFFGAAAAWVALASQEQVEPRSLRWPFIAGLAVGAATVTTQTQGAWITLAAMTAFFNPRQNRSELIAYALGIILVLAGVIAFLAEQRVLTTAFNDIVVFPLARYASIQYVPYAHSVTLLDRPLEYVFPLAGLLLVLVIVRDQRRGFQNRRLRVATAFALAGFLGCFPRPDITHIGFAVPLALPLLALCAAELTRQMRPAIRRAIAIAALIVFGAPSALAFSYFARATLRTPTVPTPRGDVAFLLPDFSGMAELLPLVAATSSRDGFFFYPQMPLLSFLTAREHVSEYEYFIPWYTTAAQYRNACLSTVHQASWMVTDKRFADYSRWKGIYPSMPPTKPLETIQFEQILDQAFDLVATKGLFELYRRRNGISDSVCDAIAAEGREHKVHFR